MGDGYIYGDVLFVINFSMDFFTLYITGRLLSRKLRAWRMAVAATIGGIYGVGALFIKAGGAAEAALNLAAAAVICLIAFSSGTFGRYMASVGLFYVSGALLGGITTGIFTFLGKYKGYIDIGGSLYTVFGEIPIFAFILMAGASAGLTSLACALIKKKKTISSADIKIRFGDKESELECLVDSGNLLTEPISGAPVIFIKEAASGFIPEELRDAMKTKGRLFDIETAKKLRVIPSETVSGKDFVMAVKPDGCYIGVNGKKKKRFEPVKAVVAVDFTPGSFGGYPALCPCGIL